MGRKRKRVDVHGHASEVGSELHGGNQGGNVLSPENIEVFERDGFVLLKDAFPPSIAEACRAYLWNRLEHDGIYEYDPQSWVKRRGISGLCNVCCTAKVINEL